jgi:gingipain R
MKTAVAFALCALLVPVVLLANYQSTTIYQIQQGFHAVGDSVGIDSVVVTAVDNKPTTFGFVAQELPGGPWSGVLCYTASEPCGTYGIEVGDLVAVRGIYEEYTLGSGSSLTEVDVRDAWVIETDYGVPDCEILSCGDLGYGAGDSAFAEQWEGVYVCVDTVQVVALGDYQEWTVVEYHTHPGSGLGDSLRIDDKLVSPTLNPPAVGDTLSLIRGVYSEEYDNYRLWPRGISDLVFMGPPPGPNLLMAYATSDTMVRAMFDRPLQEASAEDVNNYYLQSGTPILQAILNLATREEVILITDVLSHATSDSLVVCDVMSEDGYIMPECQTCGFEHFPCTWIAFDDSLPLTPPDVQVIGCSEYETTFRVVLHGFGMADTVVGYETFQYLMVPEMVSTYETGRPELPALGEMIGLSVVAESVEVTSISTLGEPYKFPNLNIWPLQLQPRCEYEPGFTMDSTFYADSSVFYPSSLAETGPVVSWHRLPTCNVQINPFQYNPVTDTLRVFDTLYVTLGHVGSAVTDTVARSFAAIYEALANYDCLMAHIAMDMERFRSHELFIVADNLYADSCVTKLIEYKKKKGFRVTKMKASDAGADPAAIKNTIKDFYNRPECRNKPKYVTFIGDHGQIPGKVATFGLTPAELFPDTDVLSDEWYEMMGPEGKDFVPDLMVGRLPTNDPATIRKIINKKIRNDTTAGSFITKELLAAHRQDRKLDRGDGVVSGHTYKANQELVDNLLSKSGFFTSKQYGSDGGTVAGVKTAIEGGVGEVIYRGHGTPTTWSGWDKNGASWTKTNVSGLNVTGKEPIIWAIACYNNKIDHSEDCIGEAWLKTCKATAHFGSSRAAPTLHSNYLNRYLAEVISEFAKKNETADLGTIIMAAKARLAGKYDPTKHAMSKLAILEYLLLGDPDQTKWVTVPKNPDVTIDPSEVIIGENSVTVTVKSGGSAVEGAIVTVLKEGPEGDDEVLESKYTDASGNAAFTISPQTTGNLLVTVWGRNLSVHTYEIPVERRGWRPGDPHKMHFPQLPDPDGIDVNFTYPKVLADDWECSESGPVTDIHFWFSAKGDWLYQYGAPEEFISNIHVSIHDNIPDPDGPGPLFSMPGDLRWQADFAADSSVVFFEEYGYGSQDWYDPNTGLYIPEDHLRIYQCNIVGIPDPFDQEEGTIYWLDLSVATDDSTQPTRFLGWKTADRDAYPPPYTGMHFEDDAVWGDYPLPVWGELRYPSEHPDSSESIDLAFVITHDTQAAIDDGPDVTPRTYSLGQNFPNPFGPSTTIHYEVPGTANVQIAVYNVKGEQVRVLVDGVKSAGRYAAAWNGTNARGETVASGVYFYRMTAGDFAGTKKLVFLK